MDVATRRAILSRHIGETLEFRQAYVRRLPGPVASLIDLKRTRAIVQFPDAPMRRVGSDALGKLVPEQWTVPIGWLILPGSLEPDPRQRPLWGDA